MTMTAILLVNHMPVAHTPEYTSELFEYLMDNYGPFTEPTGYSMFGGKGGVDTAAKLQDCYDCHAGMQQACFDLYDMNDAYLDAYILLSPWYLYEVDDENEKQAILDYCEANNIDVENDNR